MYKMGKKRLAIALLFVCTLTLWGCGRPQEQQPQAQQAQDSLKIGLLRVGDSLPFYIAQKEGLFAKYGVEVTLVEFSSGKDQSIALESGELDGLMTDMVVQGLIKKSGTDLKTVAMALGADAQEGRFLVVSAPESAIREPKDLQGSRVAISSNTMMDYLLEQYSALEGVDYARIEAVSMPDLMLRVTTLLEGKDIEAAILPDPLAAYAVLEGAHMVIDDTALGENLSQSVVAMTGDALTNQRDAVGKMLQAYNEAIALVNANPEDYREFCLEKANVPKELAASYLMPSYTAGALPTETEVQRVVDWLVGRGLIDQAYSYAEMVDAGLAQ